MHKTLELINCLMYLESAEVAHCYKQMLTSEMAFRVFLFCFCFLNICWGCQFLAVHSTWEPKTSTIIVLNGIGNGDLSWLGIILHRWDVISLYLTRAFHRKHQSIRTLSPALSFFLYPAMWANYCRNTQDTKLFHHIFASLDVHADWTSSNELTHKL